MARLIGNSRNGRMPICAVMPVVIREERLARGISQYELAGDSGLSREMLRLVENGSSVPTLETLARISAVLQMQIFNIPDYSLNDGLRRARQRNCGRQRSYANVRR